MDILASAFVILLAAASHLQICEAQKPLNVVAFGAVGDGKTDNFVAFGKAWAALCGTAGREATLVIPAGKFILKPIIFNGPCKPNTVHIQVLGKVMAPGSPAAWGSCPQAWIEFNGITNLDIYGPGLLDGQGAFWWNAQGACKPPPVMVFFNACNNLKLSAISLHDSPGIHIAINGCHGVSISSIHIVSPETSHNTDGINVLDSTQMTISDSTIAAGDDCIAINGGSNINITRIQCGPGHGISIGSLGENGQTDKVEEVHVTHCNFTKTMTGARIKTVPGGLGYARKITFEQLNMISVVYPIVIDQHYCHGQKCPEQPKAVAVSDVSFIGIHGTSSTQDAITLDCAKAGCLNIKMNDVNIKSLVAGKPAQAICNSAHGTATSVVPNVPCLGRKHFQPGSYDNRFE